MLKMSKGAAKQKVPIQTKANNSLEKSNKPETQKQHHRPQTETENRPHTNQYQQNKSTETAKHASTQHISSTGPAT
jgi:hypothetical protein